MRTRAGIVLAVVVGVSVWLVSLVGGGDERNSHVERGRVIDDAVAKVKAKTDREFVQRVTEEVRKSLDVFNDQELSIPIAKSPLTDRYYRDLAAKMRGEDNVFVFDGIETTEQPETVAFENFGEIKCSAVVVASNAVLTAKHCKDAALKMVVVTKDEVTGAEQTHTQNLGSRVAHAASTAEGRPLELVVLVFEDDLKGVEAPVFAESGAIDAAAELEIVGFGANAASNVGTGVKRLGKVRVLTSNCARAEEATQWQCTPGYEIVSDRPLNEVAPSNGGCGADSGGGTYVLHTAEDRRLAAVMIAVVGNKDDCGNAFTRHVRVDKFETWIRSLPDVRPVTVSVARPNTVQVAELF